MNKKNVLKKNYQFQEIIDSKKQKISEYLIFYYKKKTDEHLKIGISISKKFANAVKRNFYRRQIRNIMDRLNLWTMKYDVVIIIRKKFMKLSFENKIKELKKMFERL